MRGCIGGESARTAQRAMKELSALGAVLSALAASQTHIPYRNARLTHLLTDALAPTACVALVLHVHSGAAHYASSLAALQFGVRARAGDPMTR